MTAVDPSGDGWMELDRWMEGWMDKIIKKIQFHA